MIDENKLCLLVARKQLSHEKIYILSANDGRKRVVMGLANMSYSAFSGRQREKICYMDGENAFEWYKECFEKLKADSSGTITKSALAVADDCVHLEEVPVAQTVKFRKALVIEPVSELKEEVRFVLDVKKLSAKIAPHVPKADKNGKLMLSPDKIKITSRHLESAKIKEQELRSEYPHLVVAIENCIVSLNDEPLNLKPYEQSIRNDVKLFLEYMDGYERFHGNVTGMRGPSISLHSMSIKGMASFGIMRGKRGNATGY